MKVKRKRDNESEENENEIDVKKNATNNDDNEMMKNDHYFENLYQS